MKGKVRLDLQSRPLRAVLILGPWLAYMLAFAPLYRVMGAGAGVLATIPVVAVAWLMGLRATLLAGLLVVLLNTVLFNLAGLHGWDAILQAGGGPGTAALVLIGLGVGRLRDLREQAKCELARRQQVEEALRTSDERLRTLVSNVPVILFAVNRSGVFTLSEGKGLQALGTQPGEVVGRAVSDVYDTRPQIVEAVDQALAGEEVMSTVELAGLTFEATYTPVLGDDGEVTGVIGVAIDVTERKRQQAQVEAARAYLETLQDSNPDCIVATNEEGRVVVFNPGAEELLGYPAAEILGQPVEQLYPSLEAARSVMRAMRAAHNGRVRNLEATLRHKDGRDIPVLLSAAILRGADGKEQGTVGYGKDLTERKKAENDLRQTNRALAEANARATETMVELEEARDAAEAAAQAKSEFLANMSHEIRTPLNAVIGMTGLLLDTPLNPEQQDFVQTIRSSSDALLEIINQILDFSKIEAGKLELEQQPFDLRACVEESLDLVAPKAAEKGLDLAYLIDEGVPAFITGDVTRLRQILVNLLGNAVKFTEQGEVVVSVSCRELGGTPGKSGEVWGTLGNSRESKETQTKEPPRVPLSSSELHFSVRDTGIGIPPDHLDRLFQSFSQADTSTTRKYGGTGLGLTISKRLAELMGGSMWVESEVGVGSTFHFTILAEAAPSQPRVYLRGEQPQLAGRRALIVDDNATNRRILTRWAESWGMSHQTAASGPQALALIEAGEPFDVAILDMQMPEMDGLTLAAEIRKHWDAEALPLVMLTSVGGRRRDAREFGFAAYLTKPIKPSQLYDVLVGIFAGRPTQVSEAAVGLQIDPQMAQRHPLRILLAEDNAVNQKVALRLLEKMGYRADVAGNGQEALEALERQRYDVVLMDVQMPEMDGVEATRRIRAEWPAERQPRIVAMTAHALSGDREKYLREGMDDYISKPVRVGELVAALERTQPVLEVGDRGLEIGDGDERRVSEATDEDSPISDPQSPIPNLQSPINRKVLAQFMEMLGEDAPELIDTFMEDATRLLGEMGAAVEQGDAEKLERAAHALKGSSATLGAVPLSALCQELESMGRAGGLDGAAEGLAQAEAEYERVRAALGTMNDE